MPDVESTQQADSNDVLLSPHIVRNENKLNVALPTPSIYYPDSSHNHELTKIKKPHNNSRGTAKRATPKQTLGSDHLSEDTLVHGTSRVDGRSGGGRHEGSNSHERGNSSRKSETNRESGNNRSAKVDRQKEDRHNRTRSNTDKGRQESGKSHRKRDTVESLPTKPEKKSVSFSDGGDADHSIDVRDLQQSINDLSCESPSNSGDKGSVSRHKRQNLSTSKLNSSDKKRTNVKGPLYDPTVIQHSQVRLSYMYVLFSLICNA